METDDLYAMGIFIVTLFLMTALQPLGKWVSFFGSMGFLVVGLFGLELYFRTEAAQYTYIHAIVRLPTKETKHLHLFVKRPEPMEFFEDIYATKLELGQPVKMEPYGEINQLVIIHQYPFEQRLIFQQGKAKYKGFRVTHSKTCDVVLHLQTTVDTDHAEPIPIFWLKDGPGDVDFPELKYLLPLTPVKPMDKLLEEVVKRG